MSPVVVKPVSVPTLVILGWEAVWIVPVKSPVILPSILATKVPKELNVILPVVLPSAVVNPNVNLSTDSSHIKIPLSAVPLLISIPESFTGLPVNPALSWNKLSSISRFVVSRDVRVPLTVRLPATVRSDAICTSSGSDRVISADSLPLPDTVILLAVPVIVET